MTHDVAIVGAGPSGSAAAIYLARHGIDVILIEKEEVGGLALNANCIEDYPGIPDGMAGPEFGFNLQKQLASHGITVEHDEVVRMTKEGGVFQLHGLRRKNEASCVILATGTKPKQLSARLIGDVSERIFYEVWNLPEGHESVAVIGAGEAALDYSLTLAKLGYSVTILCRAGEPRANKVLMAKVAESQKISILANTEVDEIVAAQSGVLITCRDRDSISCAFAVCAVGREQTFPGFGIGLTPRLPVKPDGSTNHPGLFVAGDARRGRERHISTAVGDGVSAAVMAMECLEGLRRSK